MIADVAVNYPTGPALQTFHYDVPPGLSVLPGHLVRVPFGPREVQGLVVGLVEESAVVDRRPILGLLDPQPVLTPPLLALARWIAEYYCCQLNEALWAMLPAVLAQRAEVLYQPCPGHEPVDLPPRERAVYDALRRVGHPLTAKDLRAALGPRFAGLAPALRALERRRVIERTWALTLPRARPKREPHVVAVAPLPHDAAEPAERLALWRWLAARWDANPLPLSLVVAESGEPAARRLVRALARSGAVRLESREVRRDPLTGIAPPAAPWPALTAQQQRVWPPIAAAIAARANALFVLHGVTGSGKTEVYLQAVAATLEQGRQAIVLVPEIVLTPQTVQRFAARFPGRVALWHSRLSPGERYDEWRRVRGGAADLVIGSRSALFAPLPRLGLIVVDEEHEWSYKQEQTPRYHARDAAVQLGRLASAVVILGSASPDVVTYYRATHGHGVLLELTERVAAADDDGAVATVGGGPLPLPPVEVVDLRAELREGHTRLFSRALERALDQTLDAGEQAILFLNRRGTATLTLCRSCGQALRCRRCDLALTYHAQHNGLLCHQCNRRRSLPVLCPHCGQAELRTFGLGTEGVAAEVHRLRPSARVLRLDRDAVRDYRAIAATLERFARHEADVLVGTQMVAKGLDLPRVTLVGVVSADTALHLPDFRAAERTFQLLLQVAGRAGRGPRGGRVIVQTYMPHHYAVSAAAAHDYALFFRWERAFRAEHGYPPFGQLARLVYQDTSAERCQARAEELGQELRAEILRRGLPDLEVLGPAPPYYRRLRGRWRWQLILRGREVQRLLRGRSLPPGWTVDVDPASLL
jgi:primosomal protein N' (replication factor Y)